MLTSLFEPSPHHLTCEALLSEIPRQPFNTYSNVGYFFVASLLVLSGIRLRASGKTHIKFGALAFWIGCASVMAHALFIPFFNMIDYASIFFFVLFIAGQNPWITTRVPLLRGLIGKLVLVLFYFGLQLTHRFVAPAVFIISVFLFIAIEWNTSRTLPAALRAKLTRGILTFCAGFACLAVDVFAVFCNAEQHVFQWHGIWHLGSAAAIYLICQYYAGLQTVRR